MHELLIAFSEVMQQCFLPCFAVLHVKWLCLSK